MSLRKLFICCCCPPISDDENDGININVQVSNACCQKTQTIYSEEQPKRNLFQRAAARIVRRRQSSRDSKQVTTENSTEIFKSAMDISIPQTCSQ